MGLLDGMLGNASEVDVKSIEKDLSGILMEGEQPEKAFKIIRDLIVFTRTRLILVDKQGLRGKKKEYHSIPYRSISHFSVETKGTFDRDAEMKIWLSGRGEPIEREFRKDDNILDVQRTLASFVLR